MFRAFIHFAASKAVGESVENPFVVLRKQHLTLVYILQELQKKPEANFIFSSSCTVYGEADKMPITEDASVKPAISPYGNTKQIGEEIINEVCKVSNINSILLRYFNPMGAHPTAEIGELPFGVPQNLFHLSPKQESVCARNYRFTAMIIQLQTGLVSAIIFTWLI